MPIDRTQDFLARVRAPEVVFGTFANLGCPLSAEICGTAGFDWVLVDLEHGAGDEQQMLAQLQALASTKAAGLVRVESNDRVRVTKALDAGAAGVMVPRVETADAARAAVQHVRYPPGGDRGVAVMHRGSRFGARSAEEMASFCPLVIAEVETAETLDGLGDIAGISGVDVLFLGPADLTWSLGIPGQIGHERYLEAAGAIADQAKRTGKAAGILVSAAEQVPGYLALGYSFIGIAGESALLSRSARAVLSAVGR